MNLEILIILHFQTVTGDLQGVSQATVTLTIKRVSELLASHLQNFIRFPDNPQGHQLNMQQFFAIGNFPGITCLLDGTHVAIKNPGGNMGEVFRNRKGQFSLNVQVSIIIMMVSPYFEQSKFLGCLWSINENT